MAERTRCEAISPGGVTEEGTLPRGIRCGLDAGHDGDHTVLIPTGAPWFGQRTEAITDETRERTAERQGALEQAIITAVRQHRRGLTMAEQGVAIERALRGLTFQARVIG